MGHTPLKNKWTLIYRLNILTITMIYLQKITIMLETRFAYQI